MNLIFFGPPGVGKGTQAEILAARLEVPHVSTGAIFRAAAASGSSLGLELKGYMDKGILAPDHVTTAVAIEAINGEACANGFILDGYPRNLDQAESLSKALAENGRAIDRVIFLTAPTDEIVERMLKRGRSDDTRESISMRLEVYRQETSPVLDYYRTQDLVTEINGFGEIEEVHERIMAALKEEVSE